MIKVSPQLIKAKSDSVISTVFSRTLYVKKETSFHLAWIDDIAFKKKQMHFGWWGSQERPSVCYIYDMIIFPMIFSFVLSPLPIPQCIAKSSNAISSIVRSRMFWLLMTVRPTLKKMFVCRHPKMIYEIFIRNKFTWDFGFKSNFVCCSIMNKINMDCLI